MYILNEETKEPQKIPRRFLPSQLISEESAFAWHCDSYCQVYNFTNHSPQVFHHASIMRLRIQPSDIPPRFNKEQFMSRNYLYVTTAPIQMCVKRSVWFWILYYWHSVGYNACNMVFSCVWYRFVSYNISTIEPIFNRCTLHNCLGTGCTKRHKYQQLYLSLNHFMKNMW